MNTYRSLRDAPEFDAEKDEIIELELSAEDEASLIAAHRLELVPRAYVVVGSTRVFEHDPDSQFEAALPVEREAILIAGGHIKRVVPALTEKED